MRWRCQVTPSITPTRNQLLCAEWALRAKWHQWLADHLGTQTVPGRAVFPQVLDQAVCDGMLEELTTRRAAI